MNKKRLLIIGGMGADAGVRLAQYALTEARQNGAEKDEDYPDFVLYNLPVIGMDATGVVDAAIVYKQIIKALKMFDHLDDKVNVAMIGCNSIHNLCAKIRKEYGGILLDMVETVCGSVGKKYKCVGVLCSQSSKVSGIYTVELEKNFVRGIYTNETEQEELNTAIENVIAGKSHENDGLAIDNVIKRMKRAGAEAVIVGCTELPLAVYPDSNIIPLVDAGLETIRKALSIL